MFKNCCNSPASDSQLPNVHHFQRWKRTERKPPDIPKVVQRSMVISLVKFNHSWLLDEVIASAVKPTG